MALTRRLLKGMGLTDEQMETIIEAHTETVDGLKADLARYKTDAEALPGLQKELEAAKAELTNERKESWKTKYDAIKEEYGAYKSDQEKKAIHSAKENAYRELLKKAGVSDKRIASVLRVSDVDGIELEENGSVKDADKLTEGIKTEWGDFIVGQTTRGAETSNPAANNPASNPRSGRAAKIAAEYHRNLYGTTGKEKA